MAKKPIPVQAKKTPSKPQPKSANPAKNDASAPAGWLTFALIALAITAACYFPSLSNGLVNWDDDPNITENPNLEMVGKGQSWSTTISNIFDIDKGAVIGNYNPLPILTFAIEKSISGGEFDEGYVKLIHADNLLLHLLTVFFVIKLLLAMGFGNWGAFVGGLLFGIHPMRVESVAWATERKDVLFAVFFFAALNYYLKYIKSEQSGQQIRLYLLTFLLAVLSDFSKVQGVTLFLSMFALDYYFARPMNAKLFLEKVPFFILFLVFGFINVHTLATQGSFNDDTTTQFSLLDRACIGTWSFTVYLYKLFVPYPMSPLYPYPKPIPTEMYLGPVVFLAAIAWFVWLVMRKQRILVFGTAFFFVNVMFLLQWKGAGQGFLADRFTYVPYFGFFAIAAWYYNRYIQDVNWKTMLQVGLGIVTLAYAVWTVNQIGIWKNGGTLWTHVMKYEKKTNSLPYWNRGQYFRSLGNYEAALKDYSQATEIEPKNPELLNSRGKTYFDMAMSGKYKDKEVEFVQKALADYSNALSKPTIKSKSKAEVLINRGAAEGARGNNTQAITDITEGLKIDSTNKNGYFNRSIAFFAVKQYENALADYKEYLKYDPNNVNVWYESGMILRSMNRNEEAIKSLDQALRLNSNFGIAYLERARAKAQAGNKAGAQQDYQRAQQLGFKSTEFDQKLMSGGQ